MEWTTKEQDMMLANNILTSHYEEVEEELGVQEVTIRQEGSMYVIRADWVVELEETLEAQYGEKIGNEIAQRVISTLLTQGEKIH